MVNTREILEKLRQKPIHRTFSIERAAVSKDSRTVKLAFASDKPVEHWFGFLELSMKGSSMRTDRLDSGAPLLVDHDTRDVVGVVEGYSIGMDGIARASVRFGESVRANEVFNDVQGGIRQNVSVGFIVHKMDLIKEEKGSVPAYRSSDWEPYEISIVAVPADISVGVGRSKSADSGRNKMPINDGENTELSVTEQTREIVEFAEIFNQGDLARNMIAASPSVTLEDVRVAIRAKQPPTIHVPPMDPRAIAERAGVIYQPAVSVPRHSVRNFTGENAAEKAYRFGQWVLGGVCGVSAARQWCVERGLLDRAMSEGNNAKGGNLVPEESLRVDCRGYHAVRFLLALLLLLGGCTAGPIDIGYHGSEEGFISAQRAAYAWQRACGETLVIVHLGAGDVDLEEVGPMPGVLGLTWFRRRNALAPKAASLIQFTRGPQGTTVIAHELGHALGLGHDAFGIMSVEVGDHYSEYLDADGSILPGVVTADECERAST